ncbi:hypothetical protein BDC45DRAFT_601598 [Circinella umbellata]|nr:hypothetical protein BDC45DRAFT_601598 [Circinella umbellata]
MSMDPHKKWEIEPGVSVEDRIYEYGKTENHEHASHSFILDLDDNDIDELRNIAENARFHAKEEFDADWSGGLSLAKHGYDDEACVGSKELVEGFIKLSKIMEINDEINTR